MQNIALINNATTVKTVLTFCNTVQGRIHVWSESAPGPGGHSHWKGVWGCAAVMTPFFQAIRRSLAYQFTVNAPLLWLPFSSFRQFLHFQLCFGQNSSSLDPNFSKLLFPRPPFSRKIRSLDPTFWNPRGTHPQKEKKSWVPSPGTSPPPFWQINHESSLF